MEIPLHSSCKIACVDPSGLIAVEKPAGVLSHPNAGRDRHPSILELAYDPEQEAYLGDGSAWYLLNRLDGPTSGILLLANDPVLARVVKDAFARHEVEKTYLAVVRGRPPKKRDIWRDLLVTARRKGILRTETRRGRPNAETRMEVLESGTPVRPCSLLSLQPLTGKTHQLRVQCASRHLPIVGDATYGDYTFNRDMKKRSGVSRLLLHSARVRLSVLHGGRKLTFSAESPLPEAFTVALQ